MDAHLSDERIVIHAPPGARLAIEHAAIRAHLAPSQFLRKLVLDVLRANGYDLPPVAVSDT